MATRSVSTSHFFWTGLVEAVVHVRQAWQRRKVVGQLGNLDDRLLADIGITRQDVWSVLAEPLFVDPSAKLAERALEARRGRRATALTARAADRPESNNGSPRRAA